MEQTTMWAARPVTLREAAEGLFAKLDEGAECPCCHQYARRYRRRLNSGMARSLVWLVKEHASKGGGGLWVDVPKEAPRHVMNSREFGKLAHWGLVEQKASPTTEQRCSGHWRPTEAGVEFAHRRLRVQSHVLIYDNEACGFDGDQVDVVWCLGEGFRYDELMGAVDAG